MNYQAIGVYGVALVIIWLVYSAIRNRKQNLDFAAHNEAVEAGLSEPPSLHPVIDPSLCLGCGACVKACPEREHHSVLGLVNDRALLVEPTNCIGHGACKEACPFDAISLVFGTETRGVEIPILSADFQTSVPGIFIAGELGGMGLIRNATVQGIQAIEAICSNKKNINSNILDVLIVGAGPAGFSASLKAKEKKLNYVTIEQDSLGGSVFQYPRGKLVMTSEVTLPIVGKVKFSEVSKETLLQFWKEVENKSSIKINYQEKLINIEVGNEHIKVTTDNSSYKTHAVLLAIGRRGTPRKLGVKGEELPKVVYRMIDPEQYRGQHVLVAGGGDSALEAAISISEQPDTTVTLSYRGDAFSRAKKKNRQKLELAENNGTLKVILQSSVLKFDSDAVTLKTPEQEVTLENNAAIICAGGVLPNVFLKQIGIHVETKHGTA